MFSPFPPPVITFIILYVSYKPLTWSQTVPTSKYYRHLDPDLPEPVRARHLLIWCSRRAALDSNPSRRSANEKKSVSGSSQLLKHNTISLAAEDHALVAKIQDRVLKQLMELKIDIPLYDAGVDKDKRRTGKSGNELEDDPENVKNRELWEKLKREEERLVTSKGLGQPVDILVMKEQEKRTPCGRK